MDDQTRQLLQRTPVACREVEHFIAEGKPKEIPCDDAKKLLHKLLNHHKLVASDKTMNVKETTNFSTWDGDEKRTLHISRNADSVWLHSYDPDDSWGQQHAYHIKFQ